MRLIDSPFEFSAGLIIGFVLGIIGNLIASAWWDRLTTKDRRRQAAGLCGTWKFYSLDGRSVREEPKAYPTVISMANSHHWGELSWVGSHNSDEGDRRVEGRLVLDRTTNTSAVLVQVYVLMEDAKREYIISDVIIRSEQEMFVSPRNQPTYKDYLMRKETGGRTDPRHCSESQNGVA